MKNLKIYKRLFIIVFNPVSLYRYSIKYINIIFCSISLVLLFSSFSQLGAATINRDELIAIYLLRLSEKIQWPNQAKIKQYHMHIIDDDDNLYELLQHIAKIRKLHGIPLKVTRSSQIKLPPNVHLVYLSINKVKLYPKLYQQLKNQSVLLISDGMMNSNITMIDLVQSQQQQVNFKINKANILNQGLGVHPDIILLGGTEIDIAHLYREGQKKLNTQKLLLEKQSQKLVLAKKKASNQKKRITKQQSQINDQENKFKQIQQDVSDITKEKKILTNSINKKKKEVEKYKKKLNTARKKVEKFQQNYSFLQIALDKKSLDLKQSISDANQQREKVVKQQLEIDGHLHELKGLHQDIKKFSLEKNNLTKTLQTYKNEVSVQEQKLLEAHLKVAQLQQTYTRQKQTLEQQSKELTLVSSKAEKQTKKVNEQRTLIKKQKSLLSEEELHFKNLQTETKIQKENLQQQTIALKEREILLQNQQDEIDKRSLLLENQVLKIKNQNKTIHEQEQLLLEIEEALSYQQWVSLLIGIVALLVLVLTISLWLINRKRKFTNHILYKQKEQLEQKALELNVARETADRANKSKSIFLAKMSHEIRTPLHGVVGLTQLLSHQNLNHKQTEIVEKLTMSTNLLHQLIDDVLDLAKIESNKLHLEQVPFDFYKTIDECLTPFEVKSKEKNIQLTKIIDPSLPQYLLGDPYRISQILLNLTGNALKFTNVGVVSVEFKVLASSDKHILLDLSVTDTGIGISAEQQQKIFTSFIQADNSVTREYGGTGLGLSICRQLVALMSGTISVKSTEGKGSTFNCTIPLSKPSSTIEIKELPITDEVNHNIHVLVVDDELINRFLAQGLLEDAGFKVTLAEGGEIALKIAEEEKIDLVLMDLHMPDLNGWDTTKLFRSSLLTHVSEIPIIGLTADVLKESRDKCIDVGMNLVVSKPFQMTELKEVILTLLKKQN